MYSRREANQSHLYKVKTQGSKPMSPLHYSAKTREAKSASPLHCISQNAEFKVRISASLHWSRRRARSPRPSITAVPRRKVWSPHLDITTISRRIAWSLRIAKFRVGVQHASLETRVSTMKELCVSIVTALIIETVITHVMRGVNPHYRGFSGDSFTPKTPINSLVCYWRVEKLKSIEKS